MNCCLLLKKIKKTASIIGSDTFRFLRKHKIKNEIVSVEQCYNIYPFNQGPIFQNTEIVFIRSCDKNFLYHWMNQKTFPFLTNVFLISNPCDPEMFDRFPNTNFYLSDYYKQGEKATNNIILVPHKKMIDIANDLQIENLILENY